MLLHLSNHSAQIQSEFCKQQPRHSTCGHCGQLVLEKGMKAHSRCLVPLVSSGAPDGAVETDAECDARFEGQFMSGFDGAYFRAVDGMLTEEVARDGDYHTITHPDMDPSLRGWVQIGLSKLLAAMANPALSKQAKSGAHKLLGLTPALLFHTSRRMSTQSQSRAASLAMRRDIDDNAKLWLLRRIPELVEHMLAEQAALRRDRAEVDPTTAIVAAVRQSKFTTATEVLSSVAGQRETVQMMPTEEALPELNKAHSAEPAPAAGYTGGKAFPDADAHRLQAAFDSMSGPILTGKSFLKGLAKVKPGKAGGATPAKREHWDYLLQGNDELSEQFAYTYDRIFRHGIAGLPSSDPFCISVRNMLCGKPTFALTKPGKKGEGRSVSPPSVLSKAVWNAALAPPTDMLRDFLAPSQVGFQTPDGSCAFALAIQAAMDMTLPEFVRYTNESTKQQFSKQTIAILLGIVKMHPRVRRRFVCDEMMKVIHGDHPCIKLSDKKLPAAVQEGGGGGGGGVAI